MEKWWVSCRMFTVQVNVGQDGKIVFAAPIVRKFLGQPFDNLKRWAGGLGGLRVHDLKDE